MLIVILVYLLSCIPAVALYLLLKHRLNPGNDHYKKACTEAMKNGLLSVLPVIGVSMAFNILFNVLGLRDGSSLLASALHDFIVLAFSEELCKSLMFAKALKKADYSYTWLDMIAFMVITATGFEILESVIYAIDSNPIQMIVRGITVMHSGYGFIEGWFYGKAKYTGHKFYAVIGFLIAWLMHGAYDFGLSDDFAALGEYTAFLSVSLALIALITFIVMIVFFAKKKKKEQYLVPLGQAESPEE